MKRRNIWEIIDGERCIYYFSSSTINPASLNITNTFDLMENIIPLLYFDWSNQKKFFLKIKIMTIKKTNKNLYLCKNVYPTL